MTKLQQMEAELEQLIEEQKKEKRVARELLGDGIYLYHTKVTEKGGVIIIGTLQNKASFDAHMEKYGSVCMMPDETTVGIEHVMTIDGYLVGLGGGYTQPQLPYEPFKPVKITEQEWDMIKNSVYPKRLYKEVYNETK